MSKTWCKFFNSAHKVIHIFQIRQVWKSK
jgi:hypothetical protein